MVRLHHYAPRGNSSVVERDLAKVDVAGSNPVFRSILAPKRPHSAADRIRLRAPRFHRLSVRPPGSQPGKAGSTPAGSTIFLQRSYPASGPGDQPFKPGTRVQIPLGAPIPQHHRPDGGMADTPVSEAGAVNSMQVQVLLGAPNFLGNRLMAGRLSLTQKIVVRPHVPQPNNAVFALVTQLVRVPTF